jgi:hypothetical protein
MIKKPGFPFSITEQSKVYTIFELMELMRVIKVQCNNPDTWLKLVSKIALGIFSSIVHEFFCIRVSVSNL